jgi:hypothetical protein
LEKQLKIEKQKSEKYSKSFSFCINNFKSNCLIFQFIALETIDKLVSMVKPALTNLVYPMLCFQKIIPIFLLNGKYLMNSTKWFDRVGQRPVCLVKASWRNIRKRYLVQIAAMGIRLKFAAECIDTDSKIKLTLNTVLINIKFDFFFILISLKFNLIFQ